MIDDGGEYEQLVNGDERPEREGHARREFRTPIASELLRLPASVSDEGLRPKLWRVSGIASHAPVCSESARHS